ncbi:MAG: heme exporter protein CcmD [Sneathiella sp.]
MDQVYSPEIQDLREIVNQIATFFDMGGYGLFVWPCFGLSAIVLLALYFRSHQKLKAVKRELSVVEGRRSQKRGFDTSSVVGESKS